jgi:hypothetical protein
MTMNAANRAVCFGFVLIGLSILCACSRAPAEQRLRAAVDAMQEATQAHKPRDFLAYVASDFTGNNGEFDREGLGGLLRAMALRNEKINVLLGTLNIEMLPPRATLRVTVTLTGGSGGIIPERGAVFSIVSGWRDRDGHWECYNAIWTQEL